MSYGAKGGHSYGKNRRSTTPSFVRMRAALHDWGEKDTFSALDRFHKAAHKYHSEAGNTALAEEYGYLISPEGRAALKADRRRSKRRS